jgi:beta-galactosidase
MEAGLDRAAWVCEAFDVQAISGGTAVVSVRQRLENLDLTWQAQYTFNGSNLLVSNQVHVGADVPTLPRLGMRFVLDKAYESMRWYGRGPHESYWDRKSGAPLGIYSGTVSEQYVPYIMPQEFGNKTDVRWVTFRDGTGGGLRFRGAPLFEVSAKHYTDHELFAARHIIDLDAHEEIYVNIDWHQMGLGGASCGPMTLPQYQILPGEYTFTFVIETLQ